MIRLVYELLMMAVLLLKNVISINNKLRSQNGNEEKNGIFMVPDMGDLRQQLRSLRQHSLRTRSPSPGRAPVAKFLRQVRFAVERSRQVPRNQDNNFILRLGTQNIKIHTPERKQCRSGLLVLLREKSAESPLN